MNQVCDRTVGELLWRNIQLEADLRCLKEKFGGVSITLSSYSASSGTVTTNDIYMDLSNPEQACS